MADDTVFETYYREYLTLSQEIKDKIASVQTPNTNNDGINSLLNSKDQKVLYMNQIKRDLEEADEIV
jgi:hypothetical protein